MAINPGASSATISGTVATYFDPATPSVAASFNAASIAVHYGGGTFAVRFDPSAPAVSTTLAGSMAVFFDPANPAVNVGTPTITGITNSIATHIVSTGGTLQTKLDPSSVLAGISSSIATHIVSTSGTLQTRLDPSSVLSGISSSIATHIVSTGGTLQVKLDPSSTVQVANTVPISGTITGITNSIAVYFDRGNPSVTVGGQAATLNVQLDPGHELGSIKGSNSSIAIYFDRGNPAVNAQFANIGHTSSIFSASGTVSSQGGSGLNTIISPSANYSFKVFAFSLTTTGVVSNNVRFTNGSTLGGGELWRVALQAPSGVVAGANLAVTPPGYLFATGTNTTLALYLGEASTVHYSVAYIKESA